MKRFHMLYGAVTMAVLLTAVIVVAYAQGGEGRDQPRAPASPVSTAFTYQGQLKLDGEPVDQACRFRFGLYDAATLGNQVGVTRTRTITLTDGLFATNLDFGDVFTGTARWLEVAVRCGGGGSFTSLGRQELTAAPYALYALGAPWSGLTGVPSGFSDGVDDVGLTGVAWTDVLSRPSGLDDGDDDTVYTAGAGLLMTGTEMSVDFAAVSPLSHTHSLTAPDVLKYFEPEALVPTHGAHDWEPFTIDGSHYLAVANYHNGSTPNINSEIYRWDGTSFTESQSIPTNGAFDWEFFTIGSDHYLAVANSSNGSTHNIDSKIYRWNGTSFTESQSIPTSYAADWESFTIGEDHYLAVANYQSGSKVYKWVGSSFAEFQSIPTNGAWGWEFFTIGSDHYLVVANYPGNINSTIYRWNGASFAAFQSIPTNYATDWEFFTIGGDHYLAVTNMHNGSTPNINSRVYKWVGSSFAEFQSIPTNRAYDWEFFTVGGDHYLAVANYYNGSTRNIDSRLYRWNGTNFVQSQSSATHGAMDWAFFTIGSDHYLAVANDHNDSTYNTDSAIYRARLASQAGTTYLWGQSGAHVYYSAGHVGVGTTSPQSALQVEGYVQLDTLTAAPPSTDCDEAAEHGRMKVDAANDLLYICTASGWITK